MSRTVRQVRDGLRSRVAALTGSGWNESHYHPDLLGTDTRSRAHLSWALAPASTVPLQGDRRRASDGIAVVTLLTLRWLHQLRGKAQVEDQGDALDREAELLDAVLVNRGEGIDVWLDGIRSRRVIGEGTYLLTEVGLGVTHRLPPSD